MESEELRAALRAAEAAIRAAAELTSPARPGDVAARKDLEAAWDLVLARRRELEAGAWPGRSVGAYPVPREIFPDGT